MPAQRDPGRLAQARAMKETPLKAQTLALAGATGWRRYHPLPAAYTRRNGTVRVATAQQGEKGFPDLILMHLVVPVGIAAELKDQDSYPDAEQRAWGERFAANPGFLYALWRPWELVTGEIERLLRDPAAVARLALDQAAAAAA